jgi:hypothetical protein
VASVETEKAVAALERRLAELLGRDVAAGITPDGQLFFRIGEVLLTVVDDGFVMIEPGDGFDDALALDDAWDVTWAGRVPPSDPDAN